MSVGIIPKRRIVPLLGVISLGLLISLVLFFAFRSLEKKTTQAAFERLAQVRFDHLEANLALNLNDIVSLGAVLDILPSVNRRDFSRFTAPLLEENHAIQALEWAPQVPKNLRQTYEDAARRDGLASFQITEQLSDGRMVAAGEHPEYCPVFFVEPIKGNEKALGFDLLSNPARRETINQATQVGKLTATGRIVLVQETADQYGVLIFSPIYQGGIHPSNGMERQETLTGFVLGVLRVQNIVEQASPAGNGAHSLGLVILDLDAPPAQQLLYPKNAGFDPAGKLPGTFSTTRTIHVAGRRWEVSAYPLPAAFSVAHWSSWSALIAGLLLTGLGTVFLQVILNQQSAIEQIVTERTAALKSALHELASTNSALVESEARYRRLVDLSPDAIIVGRDHAIALANKAAVELFGVSAASDLIGRRFADFVALDACGTTMEIVEQMYQQGMQLPLREGHIRRSDGSLLDVEGAASSFRESGGGVVQAVLRDNTQRKLAEAEHARLIRGIEQVAESIVITDLESTILYVNPAFEKVTGYTRAEVIGKNPRILKSDRHPASFYQEMWATLLRGETWSGVLFNKRKAGTIYQEEATISPIKNKDGEVINYLAVKRDVTQEALLREQLNQAQKMEAVGRLAGGVAHDINNILMVIQGNVEVLELRLIGTQQKYTEQIRNATARAAAFVAQLLAFSRKQVQKKEQIDANDLIRETEKMLTRVIGENVQVTCLLSEFPAVVEADSNQLVQVVLNLVLNARDAMPNGGRVIIEIQHAVIGEGRFHGAACVPGDYVVIAITDTGSGIDAETTKRIFEPFFTTKEAGKGTGLGLAMVYGIVKQSGGFVWVYSELGIGTTFKVYLPACTSAVTRMERELPNADEKLSFNKTVLLVEDELEVRSVVAEMLDNMRCHVLEAGDARSAIELAKAKGPIDLLLTDIVLPDAKGPQLSEDIRDLGLSPKVIFMSGYAEDAVVARGLAQPDTTFIPKPFGSQSLREALQSAFPTEEVADGANREQL